MKSRGAIVITGASTGIGLACALRLDKLGYRVFASVLSEIEGETLRRKASPKLEIFVLDICDAASIARALETLSAAVGDAGIAGIINNAGILGCAPLELLRMEQVRQVFEVNVIGHIAMTQAFLPLLRAGKGRIVNIGSLAGRSALPYTSPYNASKWAFRALSDTWRLELKSQGIGVVLIEPGLVKTPIWAKGTALAAQMARDTAPAALELYPAFASQSSEIARLAHRKGVSTTAIARVVALALTSLKPRPRYVVGREAKLLLAIEGLPTPLRDWLVSRRFGL